MAIIFISHHKVKNNSKKVDTMKGFHSLILNGTSMNTIYVNSHVIDNIIINPAEYNLDVNMNNQCIPKYITC